MADRILYTEMTTLGWVAMLLGGGGVALLVFAAAVGYPWRGGLVLVGCAAILLAWMTAEVHRLNRIVLTPEQLVVGREVFTPADIDTVFGVQPPLILRPGEQHRVENENPLPPGHEIRIAGGSYGRRIGTAMVVLRDARNDQLVAVFSRRPHVFDDQLTRWLRAVPDTPAELIDRDQPDDE